MPANQPKSGIRYEVLVAAALKTRTQGTNEAFLDLRSYEFSVKPDGFSAGITRTGVDVTPDIRAVHENNTFLVECKSSEQSDTILRMRSVPFAKAILEFASIENFAETSGWTYRYLLVSNTPIGKDIQDLFSANLPTRLLDSLLAYSKEVGRREYSKFKPRTLNKRLLKEALSRVSVIPLTDQLLFELYNSDGEFKRYCEEFSGQLRRAKGQLYPIPRAVLSIGRPMVIFKCNSISHEHCDEIFVDGYVCHIGNARALVRRLLDLYSKGSKDLSVITTRKLGYSPKEVVSSPEVSPEIEASVLSDALDKLISGTERTTLMSYLVPGTFDVVLCSKERLGKMIKDTYDSEADKYRIDHIPKMKELGVAVKVPLAMKVMKEAYKVATHPDHYDVETDNENVSLQQ
jgi:hypothetical protein